MQGATDGGKHIEAMRTEHMKRGQCPFWRYCGNSGKVLLEFHHESYHPERGIRVCHRCHHRIHFRPYNLSDAEKEILLRKRHGDEKFWALKRFPRRMALMRKLYVAPGRRPAQVAVRREVRRRYRDNRTI
jgi:hypothetical protein